MGVVPPCITHEREHEHPNLESAAAFVEAHRGHFRHPAVDPPPYHCRSCGRWWTARPARTHTGEHRYPTREEAEAGLLARSAQFPRLADVRPYHCEPCDAWFTPGDISVACPEHSPRPLFATREAAMAHLAGRFGGVPQDWDKVPHQCRQCGDWYLPPRVCMRHPKKGWYATWREAADAAERMTRAYPDTPNRAYGCEHCGQFHLTTKEPAPVNRP